MPGAVVTDWAINVAGMAHRFGKRQVLADVSLQVPTGTIVGLLGMNGAGKTTFIRCLLGLLVPSHGQVEVLGLDVRREGPAVRARTGVLLEHTGLYEHLSAEANLQVYGRIALLPASERRDRIGALLTAVGLEDRRHELVRRWSRGMKQKLAVARALMAAPPLLMLDEPTAGLDPLAAESLLDTLMSLVRDRGLSVLLTSHHLHEVERWCHRTAILTDGRIVVEGTPASIRGRAPTLGDAYRAVLGGQTC